MANEDQITEEESEQLQALDQIRSEQQLLKEREAQKNQEPELKRMSWTIFLIALGLILAQTATVDLLAVSIVLYIVGWLIGAAASAIVWLILRPYKKSMREAGTIMNIALIVDALPFLDVFPVDIIALIYAFVKSRSKIVQKVTHAL